MNNDYIVGAGGGGSSQSSTRVSVEDPNTLRSKSYATIIDLLGEGEWEEVGVGGLKGVYFDNVVAQNSDGTYNFDGVSYETRSGTIDQSPLTLSAGTASTYSVGISMKWNQPVEKYVEATDVDYARVVVGVSRLSEQDPNTGDTHGTIVQFQVEYKPNGYSSWIGVPSQTGDSGITQTIAGKTNSAYERQVTFRLEGSAPYYFRVTRQSPDSTSDLLQNSTVFQAVSVVSQEKLNYPCSVLAMLS